MELKIKWRKLTPYSRRKIFLLPPIFSWLAPPSVVDFWELRKRSLFSANPRTKPIVGWKTWQIYPVILFHKKKTFSFKNKSLALQMEIVWIFVESSTKKARCLLLKALQKQDVFRWKLYKSRMSCIEIGNFSTWQIFAPQIP